MNVNLNKPDTLDTATMEWIFSLLIEHARRQDVGEPADVIGNVANEIYAQIEEPWQKQFLFDVEDTAQNLSNVLPSGGDALDSYCEARASLVDLLDTLDELEPRKPR